MSPPCTCVCSYCASTLSFENAVCTCFTGVVWQFSNTEYNSGNCVQSVSVCDAL